MAASREVVTFLYMCGGRGTRTQAASPQPKPCVPLWGRPLHRWALESVLASPDLKGVAAHVLVVVPDSAAGAAVFESVRAGLQAAATSCASTKVSAAVVPELHGPGRGTRGPVETLALAVSTQSGCIARRGPVWVLDNDVIHDPALPWASAMGPDEAGIVVSDHGAVPCDGGSSPYGHVMLSRAAARPGARLVHGLVEKRNVSNTIIMGAYGFGSLDVLRGLLHRFRDEPPPRGDEWFMSHLMRLALPHLHVIAVHAERSVCAGTPSELERAADLLGPPPPGTGAWAVEVHRADDGEQMAQMVRALLAMPGGPSQLILWGTRGLWEVPLVKQGVVRWGSPDEIAAAERLISLRAVPTSMLVAHDEPRWAVAALGYGLGGALQDEPRHQPLPAHVRITRPGVCVKLPRFAGELQSYGLYLRTCQDHSVLPGRFPRLLRTWGDGSLELEWCRGASLARMHAYGVLTADVFARALDLADSMHAVPACALMPVPPPADCMLNYLPKLEARLRSRAREYERLGLSPEVLEPYMRHLREFFGTYTPDARPLVHGDLWLGNIVWDHSAGCMRTFDARGRLGDQHCMGGDASYDLAKLLQSLAGFDHLLTPGAELPARPDPTLLSMLRGFAGKRGVRMTDLWNIALLLAIGAMPFHAELREGPSSAARARAFIRHVAKHAMGANFGDCPLHPASVTLTDSSN